jgi:hypothetical protein
MMGSEIPISQRRAPLPKPMVGSCVPGFASKATRTATRWFRSIRYNSGKVRLTPPSLEAIARAEAASRSARKDPDGFLGISTCSAGRRARLMGAQNIPPPREMRKIAPRTGRRSRSSISGNASIPSSRVWNFRVPFPLARAFAYAVSGLRRMR